MFHIRPKNYKEAICLKQCLQLKNKVPDLNENQLEEIFRFVMEDSNFVSVTPGLISLRRGGGEVVKSYSIAAPSESGRSFDSILLTAAVCRVTYPYVASHSDGDSGSSGNNNNNNNNNNNG